MTSKFRGFPAVLAACVLAAGCGGGGGGGEESTPRHYLFLSNDGGAGNEVGVILQAIDPEKPDALVTVEPTSSTILDPVLLTVGRWGGTDGTITHAHTRAVVYWKDRGDGQLQLYWAEGRILETAPVPVQLSNLHVAGLDQACGLTLIPDHADPASSLVVARWTAAEETCSTGTIKTSVIPLSAGSTVNPPTFTQPSSVLGAVRGESEGNIARLLVLKDSGLYLESPDLAGEKKLTDTVDAQLLVEWAGRTWLRLGTALKTVDADGVVTAVTTPVPFDGQYYAFDEARLYFVPATAGATIYSLPLDGSGAPAPVLKLDAAVTPSALAVSDGRVIYRDGEHHWSSVPKEGGASTPVFTELSGATLTTAGTSLFFTDLNEASLADAVSMNEDGTDVSLHSDIDIAMGWSFLGSDSLVIGRTRDRTPRYAFLVATTATGAKLTSYDALTRKQLGAQTEIADHGLGTIMAEGSGSTTLFASLAKSGTNDSDLYAVDASKDGTPIPVASHSASADFFVGTASCSTGAAGGLLAALLAALALARPFRRRTR